MTRLYSALLSGPFGKLDREYTRDGVRFMTEFGLSSCARRLRAEPPEDLGKFKGLLACYDDGPA